MRWGPALRGEAVDGQTFIDSLATRAPEHIAMLCLIPRDEPVQDALLMYFARHFATHAQEVAKEGDLGLFVRFRAVPYAASSRRSKRSSFARP